MIKVLFDCVDFSVVVKTEYEKVKFKSFINQNKIIQHNLRRLRFSLMPHYITPHNPEKLPLSVGYLDPIEYIVPSAH